MVVSYKNKHTLTIWSFSLVLPKGVENLGPHKNLYMDVNSSFICNDQSLEVTKMSFSRLMDKQTVVHIDNEILFSAKKKRVFKPINDMEEP